MKSIAWTNQHGKWIDRNIPEALYNPTNVDASARAQLIAVHKDKFTEEEVNQIAAITGLRGPKINANDPFADVSDTYSDDDLEDVELIRAGVDHQGNIVSFHYADGVLYGIIFGPDPAAPIERMRSIMGQDVNWLDDYINFHYIWLVQIATGQKVTAKGPLLHKG